MLALMVVSLAILSILGMGLIMVAYGVRHQAIATKNEATAMLAAEAGYEKALFWMSQQRDMQNALLQDAPGSTGTLQFEDGHCDYNIEFFTYIKSRPVYRVTSAGYSGVFSKTVDVLVVQAISGWDMGKCRVPSSSTGTTAVHYANGETIDIPLHINKLDDDPDDRDINISGSPQFLQRVAMGESRYRAGGSDKYADVIGLFEDGIYFDQPDSRITDETSIQSKVDRFSNTTDPAFKLTPAANAPVTRPNAAVQLEFFVEDGVGKVRITNDCTVRGFQQDSDSRTWDFRIEPGSNGTRYQRYDTYGYHLMPENADSTGERFVCNIEQTYVSQSIGGVESEPGGQIFVNGNVIIGGNNPLHGNSQNIKGKITVVATGNIWIADAIKVSGDRDDDSMPAADNPNILGLIAQGVVKVVDPGMSDYSYVDGTPIEPNGFEYVPIGQPDNGYDDDSHKRHLPEQMEVEAAITVGGGGWGAENVRRSSYGGRKEISGSQDDLIVRGTIAEAVRGVVGLIGSDGYLKHYYLDERLLEGVLPGDIWLKGKYIPTPAGWHDY